MSASPNAIDVRLVLVWADHLAEYVYVVTARPVVSQHPEPPAWLAGALREL